MTIPSVPGIPIGETMWTDETGRAWNSYGSLILTDDLVQTTRQKFAAYLQDQYLDSWNVYASPPDTIYAPAIIISPGDPYITGWDQGGPEYALWSLECVLVVNRAQLDESMVRLEFGWAQFQSILAGFENARWVSFGEVEQSSIADVEYLTGTVSVGIVDKIMQN